MRIIFSPGRILQLHFLVSGLKKRLTGLDDEGQHSVEATTGLIAQQKESSESWAQPVGHIDDVQAGAVNSFIVSQS
jgi:hypothetical protein